MSNVDIDACIKRSLANEMIWSSLVKLLFLLQARAQPSICCRILRLSGTKLSLTLIPYALFIARI
jgi:hypothetical protein